MNKSYKPQSILAPIIDDFITEKRALGFPYKTTAKILYDFDYYCHFKKLASYNISRDFLEEWLTQSETEGQGYRMRRVSASKVLLEYMASHGYDVYIPHDFSTREKRVPHILCQEEITAFFQEVDAYKPANKRYYRLANEYKVLFRLIITCGLRNSEACGLLAKNIDLDKGIITILNGKGNKDRLVHMANDLRELCMEYYAYICAELGFLSKWFFPSSNPSEPLSEQCIDVKFNELWRKTSFSTCCNNKPTVQDLRHTFVTMRINKWIEDGVDIKVMLPYLSKHLGHKSPKETHYYYHLAKEAFQIIRQYDKTTDLVIPEVSDHA